MSDSLEQYVQLDDGERIPWCDVDRCPADVCRGPHYEVTEPGFGTLILPVGLAPEDIGIALASRKPA